MSIIKNIDLELAKKEIGRDEPVLKFGPIGERPLKDQIDSLTKEEKECFDSLKVYWKDKIEKHNNNKKFKEQLLMFNDEMILRFARCSPGKTKFNEKTAKKVMNNYDQRYLKLTVAKLEDQLLSKTLFPIPHLKSKDGHSIFYMRPSRYYPKTTSTQQIIDNLAYCMDTMCLQHEKSCTEGIAFMANMDDWCMTNFSINYCYQFMMMLQGRIPVRVRLFLIINPPTWFDTIWKIMKPMLAADFRKKTFMISKSEVKEHLSGDYEKYLPDDFTNERNPTNLNGQANIDDIVNDYITYRKYIEEKYP